LLAELFIKGGTDGGTPPEHELVNCAAETDGFGASTREELGRSVVTCCVRWPARSAASAACTVWAMNVARAGETPSTPTGGSAREVEGKPSSEPLFGGVPASEPFSSPSTRRRGAVCILLLVACVPIAEDQAKKPE